jgi:hypothetical protein
LPIGRSTKATADNSHEGVICIDVDVDENRQGGSQVHFLVPVTVVSAEIHLAPRHNSQAAEQGRPYLPGLRQLSKELEKYPNAELVDVTDKTDHVCAAILNGKLRIDANENQETVVHIAVPVATIRDGVNRLEEVSTGI